jgi:hypothetical protein
MSGAKSAKCSEGLWFVDKPGSARQYELLFLPQEMPKWRNWQTR